MSSLLHLNRVCKSYPSGRERLKVLIDLDLELEARRMLAVTGASGSGKSTLLHLIGGMEAPERGQIVFDGRDLGRLSRDELARFRNQELGFIFQFHHLLPEFTAQENVMMPLLLRRQSASQASTRAASMLAQVGLAERAHHRPGELSGGEQQRVAVARALVGRPRLLLADEPTGNLDAGTSRSIHQLLFRLHAENNLTSILVTHDEQLASQCEIQRRLEGGRLH